LPHIKDLAHDLFDVYEKILSAQIFYDQAVYVIWSSQSTCEIALSM